ncbi:MAG: PfkB family carbohydrate kinase, partial [Mycobacterium sp.]
MARVCVVGSVNTDMTFTVAALPIPGQTLLATSLHTAPGGKGGNQAVAAARAGARVQFVGAVGDDPAAERLRRHLQANRVGIDGLISLPGPSGTAAIVVDTSGENTIVVAPGTNGHVTLDSPTARAVITDADVLSLQLEIPVATAVVAAQQARSTGAIVMVNASPAGGDPEMLVELAGVTDVVIVNEAEASEWHWPVPHLVITRGAAGASYVGADDKFSVPAPAVEAVDAAGAGDVFAGVLAADWSAGRQRALRRACA